MKSFLTKNFFIIIIVTIAAILRFWQLTENPPALFTDEVSNAYNAYSILKTAKDEYGNFMPLTFRTFGDYNLAFSVYTLVPSIAVFGLNEFGVRFPSAFLGTITVLFTYLMTKKLFDLKIAIFAAFFLAISPWHLQFSRYDHEANFMLSFSVIGATILLYAFKKPTLLPLSALSFGLALNSYHGAKVWIPCLLVLIFAVYRKEILKFKKLLILPLLILLVSLLPIILNIKQSLIRGQSVGIFQSEKPIQTFTSNYLSHYSLNFLFVEGDKIGRHSVSGMGELFVFQLPLIALGLLTLVKLSGKSKIFTVGWLLLAAVPAGLAQPAPHALRSILFTPAWAIVSALGLVSISSFKIKGGQKVLIILALSAVAFYNFVTYLHLYYKHYPKFRARDWQDGYKEMITYVNKVESDYNTVAVSNFYGWPYIFVLFYSKYDPASYHSQSEDKTKFAKYEFFGESWGKTKPGKALVVTPYWQAHPPKVLHEVYAKNGDLTFTISEAE